MIWLKGTISLPTRIIANEFEKLKNEISSANVDLNFSYKYGEHSIEFENVLACCYELDENASPTIYRLKYLDRIFPNLNHKVFEIKIRWILIYFEIVIKHEKRSLSLISCGIN